jgi:hypothetical protein
MIDMGKEKVVKNLIKRCQRCKKSSPGQIEQISIYMYFKRISPLGAACPTTVKDKSLEWFGRRVAENDHNLCVSLGAAYIDIS